MKGDIELYGKLCALVEKDNQEQVWELLQNYQINKLDLSKTYDECVDIFMSAKRCDGMSKRTLDNYSSALQKFKSFIAAKDPANITTNDIRNYILYLKDELHLRKSSVNQYLVIVKIFFNWLYAENVILTNPIIHLKPLKNDSSERTPLTSKEVNRVLKQCKNNRDYALVKFFIATGCRVSEVANLKLSDVDMERRCAHVVGKGDKRRTVYFSNEVATLLKEYIKSRPVSEYLFCHHTSSAPLSVFTIEGIMRKLGRKANVELGLYPHRLRHTFATNALNSGMDIVCIQQLLGHNDLTTTQIYAKINSKMVKKQYSRIFDKNTLDIC